MNEMTTNEFASQIMLVRLKKHQLSTTVTDKATSAEVRLRKGVDAKGGTWKKKLFTTGYEQVRKIINEMTKFHNGLTVPYDDEGFAMLKASLYDEYKQRMDGYQDMLFSAVDELVTKMDAIIEGDRVALGETFDASDYPDEAEIRESIYVEYNFQALPNLEGVQINSFSMGQLLEQNEQRMKAVMDNAAAKPMQQLLDLVEKVKGTLGDPDKIFRNTLVNNLKECLDSIEHLNLTNAPEVTNTAAEAKKLLDEIGGDLEALRKDKSFRSDVANKAAVAADRISAIAAPKLKK